MEKKVVAVGMSGGVDSSVTAYLLKEQGYEVIGITMKQCEGLNDIEKEKSCCSIEDVNDAKRVCDHLGIPHYTINMKADFKVEVIDYFIDEYRNGRTPNPCVVCNRKIKLGKLLDFAKSIGAEYIATGHYAVIKEGKLYAAMDNPKDQAYFLAQIKKESFNSILFPLAGYPKERVREIAKEAGIKVFDKKDSQEICFIENDDYKDFLKKMTNGDIAKKGDIINENGKILGKHDGTPFYTIGQRKGIGIASPFPLYVLGVDAKENKVIVGENEKLYKESIMCNNINIIGAEVLEELKGKELIVKCRSRDSYHRAVITKAEDDIIEAKFIDPVRAVTPGQVAVFYQEDGLVMASGFIEK